MENLREIRLYAEMVWPNKQTDTRKLVDKDDYGIGEVDEKGRVYNWLTPFLSSVQLLGYLQGLHKAKANPSIFD